MDAISGVLEAASKFKVEHTSPVLQHEFCQLWNQVVLKAQRDNDWMIASRVLRQLRKVYLTLHHNTNSVPTRFDTSPRGVLELESGYPVCRVVGHNHPNSVFTALAHAVIHDDAAQSPPSFPSPAFPSHIDKCHRTVPLPDDSHPTYQTAESSRVPVTSPDQAISASGIQHTIASGNMTPYPTPEASTSAHPRFFTSQPTAVSLQHNTDPLTPSDSLNLPSPASNPVLDNIPPTGPSLSTHSRITRSDLSLPLPESHCPITVASAPGASPGPITGPDLGTTTEDDGSPMPGLPEENDALGPPSAHPAIDTKVVVTPDHLLQFSPQSLATESDVAIAAVSLWEPNAEHAGDQPQGPSRYHYDIV